MRYPGAQARGFRDRMLFLFSRTEPGHGIYPINVCSCSVEFGWKSDSQSVGPESFRPTNAPMNNAAGIDSTSHKMSQVIADYLNDYRHSIDAGIKKL